jgi:opacity protein-like surface antigen
MGRIMTRKAGTIILFTALLSASLSGAAHAEDADRFRPYFRFGNGDISANWGVYDLWTFGLGANFDRHWGGELAVDYYEMKFRYQGRTLGEISSWNIIPQVRLRQPLMRERLVPYLVAGAGASFLQFKDEEAGESVQGTKVDIAGSTFTVTAGAGVDYFLNGNVALNLEGKYYWVQPLTGMVNGNNTNANLSTPTVTAALRVYTDENVPRPLADTVSLSNRRGYIGLRLGGALLTDDRLNRNVKLVSDSPSVGAVNQTGGLLFGWDFNRNWGAELAWDFLEYGVDLNGKDIGEYSMKLVIPQLRYRLPTAQGRWVPYLVAGAGASYSEFNDRTGDGYGLKISAKGFHPALSVGAGIEYFLNRNLSVLADTGWLYLWRQKFSVENFAGGRGDSSDFLFRLGVRAYLFD